MELKIRLGGFETKPVHRELVLDVLNSGRITEGPYTHLFEQDFSKYLGVKHCIACTNGTAGLMLVFKALQIIEGRPLTWMVPATTFPATLNAITLTGNKAILCDVGDDLLIKVDEEKLKKCDGIVPVHLFGYACNMDYLTKFGDKGLYVVEDNCEGTGSSYKGKLLGGIGDAGVFSFFMGHSVGVGELGCITTNNDQLAEIIRSIKNHGRVGSSLEFNHAYQGFNFKTTEFMSALAWNEIKNIPSIFSKRNYVALSYMRGIKNKRLRTFNWSNQCSYLGYPIMAESMEYREKIIEKLTYNGIESRKMFPCLANQKAYKIKNTFPKSTHLEKIIFYVPCHQYLKQTEVDEIIKILNDE